MRREKRCRGCSGVAVRRKRLRDTRPVKYRSVRGYIRYWFCQDCWEKYQDLQTIEQFDNLASEEDIIGLEEAHYIRPEWHGRVYGGQKQ